MSTGEFTGFPKSWKVEEISNLSEAAAHHICVMMDPYGTNGIFAYGWMVDFLW